MSDDTFTQGWQWSGLVNAEAGTKSNSRRMVRVQGKPRMIKGKKALDFIEAMKRDIQPIDPLIEGDVAIRVDCWYASRRPDLAALELVKDALQGLVYKNDRQVKAELSVWNLDRKNPRVAIRIRQLPGDGREQISTAWNIYDLFGPDIPECRVAKELRATGMRYPDGSE